jgi:cephalosporin-C deacetylase-like acetyl esterase
MDHITKRIILSLLLMILFGITTFALKCDSLRSFQYTSRVQKDAELWQEELRSKLFNLMKLDDLLSEKNNIPFNPKEKFVENKETYILKEIEINSTKGRRIRVIVTIPKLSDEPNPAIVCIHGHGGKLRSVYEKNSIYKGFASELASRNFVTISCFVSQHEVYEKGRILMGERLWDLIRCVDYLESLEKVDNENIGCAGLSLGGEMAMWLGGWIFQSY